MPLLSHKLKTFFLVGFVLVAFQIAGGTQTANATVCTTQCVGGYTTQSYSCVVSSVDWLGGYYGGGWCGLPAGYYSAGTYYCYGTCTQQVWNSCATTQQVCTHPSASVSQSPATTNSGGSFALSWSSSNANSCNVTYTYNGGTAYISSGPTSGTVYPAPVPVGTYGVTNACTDSGGETAYASLSHSVVCPSGTTWNGSSCVASPPTASISQSSSQTNSTAPFTLYWSSTNASSCTVTYSGPTSPGTISSGPTSGSVSLTPQNVGTYTLTNSCTGAGGSASQSLTHTVVCPTGQTWTGTACVSAPVVTLSQSKNPTASKEPFTISWNATNASSCDITFSGPTPTQTLTNQPTSATTQPLTPQNLGVYSVSVTCGGYGASTTQSLSHTVNGSDLTAGAITPTTAKTNVPTTFSSTISNISSYSTIDSYGVLWQLGTTSSGGTVSDLGTFSVPATAGNSSATVQNTFTITSPGTYYVRACADKSSAADTGTITESNENNNCSAWGAITVTKAGDKTVERGTPVSITSTMGGISYCSASTGYPSLADGVYSAWTGTKTNNQTTSMQGVMAPPGTYDFTCTGGGLTDTQTLTILDCSGGKVWNGYSCQTNQVTGTLSMPSTCTISSPNASCPTTVSWTTQNATGPVTVERAYSPYGTIPGGTGTSGSTNVNFSPPGTYTLTLMHGTKELDRKTITVSCTSLSNWNGNVCQAVQPQIYNVSLTGNRTPSGTLSFSCNYTQKYSIVRSEGATGQFPITNQNYTGPVSVNLSTSGNYQASCINGTASDSTTVFFDTSPPAPTAMSIVATPQTVTVNKNTTLSWSITGPINSCTLTAETVCSGGHASCTANQLADESRINSILSTGTTDANDPYGPSRNIQTAVKTIAPQNNPTGNKALGTKTILMNYTTDFILDCGSSTTKKTRVNVANTNEG